MSEFISKFAGFHNYPESLKKLGQNYIILEIFLTITYLSISWLPLWYLNYLSYTNYATILTIGFITVIILDYPLGLITDKIGQTLSFYFGIFFLAIYYLGLIFATTFNHFVVIQIIFGIYQALISGTLSGWFMNSWEHASNELKEFNTESDKFGDTMSKIDFSLSLLESVILFLGGLFFMGVETISSSVSELRNVFFIQLAIPLIGFFFVNRLMTKYPISIKENQPKQSIRDRILDKIGRNTITLIPVFVGLSLLIFIDIILIRFTLSPFLNLEFGYDLFFISLIFSLSTLIQTLSLRISGTFAEKFKVPNRILLFSYIVAYPVSMILIYFVSFVHLENLLLGTILLLIILLTRNLLIGITVSIYYDFYYNITDTEHRTSQESLFNTLNSIINVIGIQIVAFIITSSSLANSFVLLTGVGLLGIILIFSKIESAVVPTNEESEITQ